MVDKTAPAAAVLQVKLRNELSEIPRLAGEIEAFCGAHRLADEIAFNVNLVLDEVITNIISYGYDDAGAHEITVELELSSGVLRIAVEDDARPFNPLAADPPDLEAGLDERRIGGLGIHFMRTLMSSLDYTRDGGCNRLTMTKEIEA
jgi:anti-sigma regulatory factor (Ser/Thr protein kinase)